jgi:hypothetical protein
MIETDCEYERSNCTYHRIALRTIMHLNTINEHTSINNSVYYLTIINLHHYMVDSANVTLLRNYLSGNNDQWWSLGCDICYIMFVVISHSKLAQCLFSIYFPIKRFSLTTSNIFFLIKIVSRITDKSQCATISSWWQSI